MMRFGDGLRGFNGFGMMSGGGMAVMIAIGVILLAALVFCTVVCIKYLASTGRKAAYRPAPAANAPNIESAMNILNARYAKGELSEEEYNKKKADIQRP